MFIWLRCLNSIDMIGYWSLAPKSLYFWTPCSTQTICYLIISFNFNPWSLLYALITVCRFPAGSVTLINLPRLCELWHENSENYWIFVRLLIFISLYGLVMLLILCPFPAGRSFWQFYVHDICMLVFNFIYLPIYLYVSWCFGFFCFRHLSWRLC